ncbi:YggT family protein [Priestia filamentosa]|uniref:YggT family protein n=1 Tax=Priestia filamentosa TaxID=1402861 RepID=UPI00058964D8
MGELILKYISYGFNIYSFMIIIYILSSWIPALQQTKFIMFIESLVEPYLSLFRRFIPPIGMVDISPIVAIFVFRFIERAAITGLAAVLNILHLL